MTGPIVLQTVQLDIEPYPKLERPLLFEWFDTHQESHSYPIRRPNICIIDGIITKNREEKHNFPNIKITPYRWPTNGETGKQAVVIVGNCPNGTGAARRTIATSFFRLSGLNNGWIKIRAATNSWAGKLFVFEFKFLNRNFICF